MDIDFEKYKPFVSELIAYYYSLPEKGAGGMLHIVLDDGNTSWGSINFCEQECEIYKDTFGSFLCNILYQFTEEELGVMYNNRWK